MIKVLSETIPATQPAGDSEPINSKSIKSGCYGIIEFIVKDKNGKILRQWQEPNLVKIFAKEMLSHRLPSSEVWDPNANSSAGGWVATESDLNEEFAARYIILGAAFDSNGQPVEKDTRFYVTDPATGASVPLRLEPGATNNGDLINPIPFSEPYRPVKKIETISYDATYQPAGIPLLQSDVRGMNNIVKLETVIKLEEYNGFGQSDSDFFVLTEVALAGGRKISDVSSDCECTPRTLFFQGPSGSAGGAFQATANGSDTIHLDPATVDVDIIKQGDQVYISNATDTANTLDQVSPFYLVTNKAVGGLDITLDRVPVDSTNVPISGAIGVYRDTLRIFSHRILNVPVKKSSDFEITIRWSIIFN